MMNRRTILAAIALSPLAACGTTTPSAISNDAALIVNGLAAVEPFIVSLAGISAVTAARIATDLTIAQGVLPELASVAVSFATPSGAAQTFVTAVKDLLGLVTVQPLAALIPVNIETVLQAAAALLPTVAAAAGMSAATLSVPVMSADAARAVLAAAKK